MEKSYGKRKAIRALLFLSLGSGIIFFCTNHLDFLIAAIQYNKMNIPNIAYIIERTLTSIFIPLIFILPSIFPYSRVKSAKVIFIASGICHLAMLYWLIPFFIQGNAKYLFTAEKVSDFISKNGYVYFSAIWDNASFPATISTILLAIVLIYTGKNFDKHKSLSSNALIVSVAFKVFLPLFYNIFVRGNLYSLYWVTNNYLELLSVGFFTLAILIAASGNDTWVECVWDQDVVEENDEISIN